MKKICLDCDESAEVDVCIRICEHCGGELMDYAAYMECVLENHEDDKLEDERLWK